MPLAAALAFLTRVALGDGLLAGRMLAPLADHTRGTDGRANGSLSTSGSAGRQDEFRRLADAFDTVSRTARVPGRQAAGSPRAASTDCAPAGSSRTHDARGSTVFTRDRANKSNASHAVSALNDQPHRALLPQPLRHRPQRPQTRRSPLIARRSRQRTLRYPRKRQIRSAITGQDNTDRRLRAESSSCGW